MANPYYVYSGAFIPGILARAEAESTEFQAVQQGFALLATNGTDSGAADAYVVATQGGQNGIYADGMVVQFKAMNANTGASTISVDGGTTVSLTDFQGQSLAGGAIVANSWVRLTYNSTFSAWTLLAPTSQVITSNTISAAAPTYKVGLTAAGGVSTACAPIDATYAIDQGIVPTWTGAHTFSAGVTFNSTVSFSGGLSLTGASNQYAATLTGNSGSGHSFGLEVNAGTTAGDVAMLVNNQAGSTAYFEINGAGGVTVGNPTGGSQGVGTINAAGLYVNGVSVLTQTAQGANPTASVGLSAVNGTATTFLRSDGAPALSVAIAPTWTGVHNFSATSGTPVTINSAQNKHGLIVTANGTANTVNTFLAEFFTGAGSGFSSGVLIEAGTTSADTALEVALQSGSNIFSIYGDGEALISAPTAATNQTTNFYQVGYCDIPLDATNTPAFQDRGKIKQINIGDKKAQVTAESNGMPIGRDGGTVILECLCWQGGQLAHLAGLRRYQSHDFAVRTQPVGERSQRTSPLRDGKPGPCRLRRSGLFDDCGDLSGLCCHFGELRRRPIPAARVLP